MALPTEPVYDAEVRRVADALYRAYGPGDATGPEVLKFMHASALKFCVDAIAPAMAGDIGAEFARLVRERGTPTT